MRIRYASNDCIKAYGPEVNEVISAIGRVRGKPDFRAMVSDLSTIADFFFVRDDDGKIVERDLSAEISAELGITVRPKDYIHAVAKRLRE